MRVDGKFKSEGEAKIEYITLVKGGPASKRGISKMYEIATLPLQAIGDESGEAFFFIPAYIDIIQSHIINVGSEILKAYVGNSFYSDRIDNAGDKKIIFNSADLGFELDAKEADTLFGKKVIIGDESNVERAILESEAETALGFTISPKGDAIGSYSYKLIIDAASHDLLFFRRHKISKKLPKGFTKEDIKRISIPFRK